MNLNYKKHIELINRKNKELVGVYRDAIKHLNISENEFWIWYTLVAMDGEHTQQEICHMWSLSKQTVNTAITKMRLKKHAYLEAIPGKRNQKAIRLTEEGRKHGEALILPITLAEEKAFGQMSFDELGFVANVFGKYIEIIRKEFDANAII